MPFFNLGRPLFYVGRRGGQASPRATGEEAPSSSSSSPSLYADLQVVTPGLASPLGPSKTPDGRGVNFALWSSSAASVTLCLLDPRTRRPDREVFLARTAEDPNVWAGTVIGLPLKGVGYAFKVDGPRPEGTIDRWSPGTLLLDPYAPLVDSRSRFGVRDAREGFVPLVGSSFVGTCDFESREFDWGMERREEKFFFPVLLHFFFFQSSFFLLTSFPPLLIPIHPSSSSSSRRRRRRS